MKRVLFKYDGKEINFSNLFTLIKDIDYKEAGISCDWIVFKTVDGNDKPCTVVLFQASNGNTDWKSNFNFWPSKPYKQAQKNLKYHRGFKNEYQSARDQIIEDVRANLTDNVIVAGWSNGGAEALICVEDLNFQFGVKPLLVTYGAPKPFFGKRTMRYVMDCVSEAYLFENESDIVPKVPPFLGYYVLEKNRVHLGKRFNIFKSFKTPKWHTEYAEALA
jgi:hypothetical protein